MPKEKIIEIAKIHAMDLGVKLVQLAGEKLIEFAKHLATPQATITVLPTERKEVN